jgi:excisionase family DNA binding protein
MVLGRRIAYSPREAAVATSLSVRRIMRAIAAGELKSTKVGRRRIIRPRDIEEFLRRAA